MSQIINLFPVSHERTKPCFLAEQSLSKPAAQHSVHPTGGSLRVFGQFAWLEVGSGKMALSHLAHQRVTRAVGRRIERIYVVKAFWY